MVSLIVVVHTNYSDLRLCIDSFRKRAGDQSEVIVVNNGIEDYDDGNADKIIRIPNRGLSIAINAGVEQSRGEFLVISNPDVIFLENSIDEFLGCFKNNDRIGIVGPRVLSSDGTVHKSARRFPGSSSFFFNRTSMMSRLFPNNKYSRKYLNPYVGTDSAIPVDWVSGCCMMIRRDLFNEVGGFDEGYFLFMEDVDICHRAWSRNGWRVFYCPESRIVHKVNASNNYHDQNIIRRRHSSIRRYIDIFFADKSPFSRGFGKFLISLREKYFLLRARFVRSPKETEKLEESNLQ